MAQQRHNVTLLTRIGGQFGGNAGDTVEAPTDICRAWFQAGIIAELPDGAKPKDARRAVVAARQTQAPPARPALSPDEDTADGGDD